MLQLIKLEGVKMIDNHTWECPDCHYSTEWDYMNLVNSGEPVCPKCDTDMELVKEDNQLVVIEVRGGVAECTNCPNGIRVEIIDYDNKEDK